MARRLALVVLLALLLWPVSVAAQDDSDSNDDDVLIRFNGPITVAQGEALDVVIGVSDEVLIDEGATVRDTLLVIDGNATVNGTVDSEIVVISGTLTLGPTARVQDVTLIRSDLTRDPAATITGNVEEREGDISFGWGSFVFSLFFWVSFTIVILVAGILFAVFAGRQLVGAAAVMTGRVGPSIVTALVVWIGLPILAVLAFFTIIGIPLGIAILIFLMPVLWFLGYLVAGARLGLAIVRSHDPVVERGKLILATVLGLLIFQIIGLVPFLGGFVVFLAGWLGSGALIYLGIRGWNDRRPAGLAPVGPAAMPAA